jgi:hypothetical protein
MRKKMPVASLLAAGLALALNGCRDSSDDRPVTFPVSGRVLQDGKPAAGARVLLTAQADPSLVRLCPHAEVANDGSFRLTTFRTGDGAPAGQYTLTLTWPLPARPGKEDEGPDRFKGRYADPRRPLRQVQIVAGANVLEPIHLK